MHRDEGARTPELVDERRGSAMHTSNHGTPNSQQDADPHDASTAQRGSTAWRVHGTTSIHGTTPIHDAKRNSVRLCSVEETSVTLVQNRERPCLAALD